MNEGAPAGADAAAEAGADVNANGIASAAVAHVVSHSKILWQALRGLFLGVFLMARSSCSLVFAIGG